MKILYYSSTSFADCDFPLVKALMEKGHNVTYLIELSPDSCHRTLFDIDNCLSVDDIIPASTYKELAVYNCYMDMDKVYIMNRGGKGNNYLRAIRNTLKVARFIREGHFEVLHTDMLFVAFQPLLYLLFRPWITTKHDPFPHSEEVSRKANFYRKLSFRLCKRFVVLNHNQLEFFCEYYRIPPSNVLVNRLGVYDNIHAFIRNDWHVRRYNVLFFGRITPYKGIEYLCEAMIKVHEIVPDATLTIAGGGEFYFDISKYDHLPYIEIKNHFVEMEELAKLVYECSVVACPYKEATQSGVIMTAFSMCKPVVATKVGGLGEMVEHGKSGLMVEPCDTDSLANSIIKLFSDNNELKRLSSYIKEEYFHGERSWGAIADKYINFYQKTLLG